TRGASPVMTVHPTGNRVTSRVATRRRAVAQLAAQRSPKPAVEGSSRSCPANHDRGKPAMVYLQTREDFRQGECLQVREPAPLAPQVQADANRADQSIARW